MIRPSLSTYLALFLCIASSFGSILKSDAEPLLKNERPVLIVPIEGTIDLGLAPFVKRAIARAEEENFQALVFRINTFGGRLDAAVLIRDAIIDAKIPTIAYIDSRAISAGALISLSCDKIFMKSGGTIGAATPVTMSGDKTEAADEKTVSYFRTEMRATAERKGRSGKIAEAMVDRDIVIEGLIEKGKLLTLTDKDALSHKMIDGQAESSEEMLALLGNAQVAVVEMSVNWAESVVRFITDPVVNSLLITIGILGIFIEMNAPGFGVGGTIALLSFATFFGGQYIVELAGWEEMTIFFLGIILLLLEIFIIPGFGLAGVLGIVAIVGSLIFSLISSNLPFTFGYFSVAAMQIALTLIVTMVMMVVLIKFFPKVGWGRRLVLTDGSVATRNLLKLDDPLPVQLGMEGVVTSSLRPSGSMESSGEKFDVISEGDFIEAGTMVRVIKIEGTKIVVRKLHV